MFSILVDLDFEISIELMNPSAQLQMIKFCKRGAHANILWRNMNFERSKLAQLTFQKGREKGRYCVQLFSMMAFHQLRDEIMKCDAGEAQTASCGPLRDCASNWGIILLRGYHWTVSIVLTTVLIRMAKSPQAIAVLLDFWYIVQHMLIALNHQGVNLHQTFW